MAQTADDIDHCCSRSLTAPGRSRRSSLPSREKGFESTTDGVVLSGERVPASTAKCCGNVAADAQTASTELRPQIKLRTNVDCIPAPTVNVAITTSAQTLSWPSLSRRMYSPRVDGQDGGSTSECSLEAFELQTSLWELVSQMCPTEELSEVRRILGHSLVEQACDLHDEVV